FADIMKIPLHRTHDHLSFGGHLTFLAFEAVRGKALSVEQRIRLTQVGLVLVVGLMVWVITNDVLRLL
ncbi:MAG: hypothetical protein P8Y10_02125, partial [Gemmatimonadales bacterium]